MRRVGLTLLCALPLAAESLHKDLARPPRRRPYDGLVIEWISQSPRTAVRNVGDRSEPAEGSSLAYTAHIRNLADRNTGPILVRWFVDGVQAKSGRLMGIGPQQRVTDDFAWEAEAGRHWIQCELVGHDEWLTIASDALTVKLFVEKKTSDLYETEFGSFARRFQDSLAGLHASWAAVREVRFAPNGIEERLRVDDVELYERGAGDAAVPRAFWDHPDFDLAVACDQGGPVAGFYIPGYSIGHNYKGKGEQESLFSEFGDNCLWHEIAHFRGVQDFYIFPTQPGDVAKKDAAGNAVEPLRLRMEYAEDTMNDPYRPAHWSDYTATVIQMKRGISRVGRCEDPKNTFGHMWRHIPSEIRIQVIDAEGKPLRRVGVEVYRPEPGKDGRMRVEEEAEPMVAGAVADDGTFHLGEDPFGRKLKEERRARWVLILLRREAVVRARYLTLMEMNSAYWRGEKEEATFPVVWEE